MKTYPLLALCLLLVGCGQPKENQGEVLGKLEAIKSQLASAHRDPVRWAFVNKREIESAIFQLSREKMEEARKAEALSPELEEKVKQFEALQSELMHKQMDAVRMRFPQRQNASAIPTPDKDYEALSNRVVEAQAPIADILARRNRQASQYREQFSIERLIAEYVKDRFDLIVDSSDEHSSRSAVLYRTNGEVLDITDGIMKLLQAKAKP